METENVWDYPRPPRLEKVPQELRVLFNGKEVARSSQAYRILETSHPPTYYIPLSDIREEYLEGSPRRSFCEFKGRAIYFDLVVDGRRSRDAAWTYPSPTESYAALKECLAFYSNRVDECYVGKEKVLPQEGDFYGGWITSNLKGPFKGPPGTEFY